jgi:hypothetical protein
VSIDRVEVAVPAARVWAALRKGVIRTLLGGILGALLGGVLGALTCVADQAGFSVSVAVRAGRLIDLEMGASMVTVQVGDDAGRPEPVPTCGSA